MLVHSYTKTGFHRVDGLDPAYGRHTCKHHFFTAIPCSWPDRNMIHIYDPGKPNLPFLLLLLLSLSLVFFFAGPSLQKWNYAVVSYVN
jgi:hypothetical protein